ncbi:penicillin-binding protein 1A [Burkholderiaceae bacterium FT117]|uniref:penicillin-binding protein 1A n=1 Tax=Zeimonas sediminis TaxID=2944268 RepID=UPI002342FA98|nr:penicillin-binding protein 1A [Zeimonas sediminis]MCM5570876.1 penicillin-binding protein 1A [Zeimonas sediminis]
MSRKPARPARSKSRFSWRALALAAIALPVAGLVALALVVALALLLANDRLPQLDALIDYRPRIPLRVYTADGVLIGEFGEERRTFVRIQDVPDVMKNAVVAAEDARFFEHSGVDLVGVARAALANLSAGGTEQGASTLTMQLAREFFLSPERTYTRKIVEILLAFRIEDSLTKEQILELYLNQIFLGKRAYGFAAAAQTYFGKPLAQVTAAEAAMLAGLPKAPSRFNPLVNPRRATERQRYILRRMLESGFLTQAQYESALEEKLHFATPDSGYAVEAPYVAELARQLAWDLYREDSYTSGLKVYTTILAEDQKTANAALRAGLFEYDRRHGYRGPERFVELSSDPAAAEEQVDAAISEANDFDEELDPAVVLEASPKAVVVSRGKGSKPITIDQKNLRFVARALSSRAPAALQLRRGAVVRIMQNAKGEWEIGQIPEVQAAFVAASTSDGAVRALVGGFDFSRNKFNRVTQAWRQPGSSFKPFIYSAALEKGIMTSTIVNDAPVQIDPALTGGQLWDPKNYDGKYDGPMPLRTALARSKNMVSIRVLDEIGPRYAQDYITRFGFDAARHPPFLTMALGAGSVTPWQMVGAISVFANGGYRIEPYIVQRITDGAGRVLAQARPARAGDESRRAIDPRNAFLTDSMLRSVVAYGTATRAKSLKRSDLAGKTGTTNDSHDAWFVGYQPSLAAVAWVGYDQPRKLGDRETGGGLALPIWIDYMAKALRGVPEQGSDPPRGIVQIDGEYYLSETRPGQGVATIGIEEGGLATGEGAEQVRDQVF